ncbi:MAG: AAA family ATPase [Candidatus Dormibacteria bacterium]
MTGGAPPQRPAAPFYVSQGPEIELFEAAYARGLPVLLKGPTGCGKTRFVSHMAWRLGRPLTTVACHDDLTGNDLVGRYLLMNGQTQWMDGPLTRAVREGGIAYLDEVVEARKDVVVVIHPLADHRRILPVDRLTTELQAPPEFMLVISFNPGYQSAAKDLKQSTRQRFVAIQLGYPSPALEIEILRGETEVPVEMARTLVQIGAAVRAMVPEGLEEGASPRTLVSAAGLILSGIDPVAACRAAIAHPITDDHDLEDAISQVIEAHFQA